MPALTFTKAHGAGNDFVIVEHADLVTLGIADSDIAELASRICDRRFGVGADGLEVVSDPDTDGAFACARLWNSDGSAAEISGNGTRCVAAYLTDRKAAPASFSVQTGAGLRDVERVLADSPDFVFRMTTLEAACRVVESDVRLESDAGTYLATIVDVGNPQCVCRVDSLEFDWRVAGAALERHSRFEKGANVSFARVVPGAPEGSVLDVRFWERGAGATLSSGTGSLGAAVAARYHGWIGSRATLRTQGGDMEVDWEGGVRLSGPARIVARGTYEAGGSASGRRP